MQYIIIALAIVLIAATVAIIYLATRKKEKPEDDSKAILLISQQINQLSESLNKNLSESTKSLNQQFLDQSRATSGIIREVTEKLGDLNATNKQVVNFADQLQSLENILRNPKQRGILGEYYLETLLSNVFQPKQFKLQYQFKNGEVVDAVIFYNNKIIPIDAKFSLEKFNRMVEEKDKERKENIEKEFKADVKKRIDETAKYIRPSEKTYDFALMFIPAEGVYASLFNYKIGAGGINTHDLLEYAHSRRVYPVSPVNFFAFLQTIIEGIKTQRVQEGISEILTRVQQLARHLNSYDESWHKLGRNLSTTVNSYNDASREFKKIDKDIYRLTDGKSGGKIEVELLDRPKEEE